MRTLFTYSLCSLSLFSFGQSTFTHTYGGNSYDDANDIVATADNGFVIIGSTSSFGSGDSQMLLFKTDSAGNAIWTNVFGGTNVEQGCAISQAADGGFFLAGMTNSDGNGGYDIYLVRTDSLGQKKWEKTYGGSDWDFGYSVAATSDGGCIITGKTYSYGNGDTDIYIIKTDTIGDTLWTKTIGSTEADFGKGIIETTSGEFVLTGGMYIDSIQHTDAVLIKLSLSGNLLWTKTFGQQLDDWGNSLVQTSDLGFAFTGIKTDTLESTEFYTVKTDAFGVEQWFSVHGGPDLDEGFDIVEANDSIIGVLGRTSSYDLVAPFNFIFYKYDHLTGQSLGTGLPKFDWREEGRGLVATTDGGYVFVGITNGFGVALTDALFMKTDMDGKLGSTTYTNITLPSPVLVNELTDHTDELLVYPNPCREDITFDYEQYPNIEAELTIFDSFGRLTFRRMLNSNSFSFNTTGMATGIYHYKVEMTAKLFTGQFAVIDRR